MEDLEKQKEIERMNELNEIYPGYPCISCKSNLHCWKWKRPNESLSGCYQWSSWFSKVWNQIRKELHYEID